jgi:hypothetical protein
MRFISGVVDTSGWDASADSLISAITGSQDLTEYQVTAQPLTPELATVTITGKRWSPWVYLAIAAILALVLVNMRPGKKRANRRVRRVRRRK